MGCDESHRLGDREASHLFPGHPATISIWGANGRFPCHKPLLMVNLTGLYA